MKSWFSFLQLEVDLAKCFINSARLDSDPTKSARCLENARKSLATIQYSLRMSAARGLSDDEVTFLETGCAQILLELSTWGTTASPLPLKRERSVPRKNDKTCGEGGDK